MSGTRRKTRNKLRRKKRDNSPVSWAVKEYPVSSTVHIKIDPSVHKGMPHPKYIGHTGKITEKRGRAYLVEVMDGDKEKHLLVRAEHLAPAGGAGK